MPARCIFTVPPLMKMEPNTLITAPTTHVTIPQAFYVWPPALHMISVMPLPGPDSLQAVVLIGLAT